MALVSSDIWSGGIDDLARTVTRDDREAATRAVPSAYDVQFTWDYAKGERPSLTKLYEKAKTSQWNAETDIDWSIGGQIDLARDPSNPLNTLGYTDEGVFGRLSDEQRATMGHAGMAWTLSQFMHGEQGALVCTA